MDNEVWTAISKLAEKGENWALLADTDPATFLNLVGERIDVQVERIKDLEAKRDPNYINPATIRQETATAMARELCEIHKREPIGWCHVYRVLREHGVSLEVLDGK